ncbi:acyltransferase family protein [Pseudoclavibacter terrae]|uniref:acyltransferase family protein n=1 Tax=Pseudoclavibacter terrae TaxID=1530195 RepID=UPI00232ED913|nr:acyltransferase [Pseudoclavibacter terrae]
MRLNSLDVVRGFAIFAMIIAHTVVFLDDREPRALEVLFHFLNDAASPLFALVIGVTAGYQLREASRWDARRKSFFAISWVIKSIVLILVGLLLSINFSGVLIVLDFLGIMMLVATPFLFLPAAWSAGAALVFLAAAPIVNEAARNWALTSASMYDPTALLLDWTVLGSAYRLTNLLPMLLIGFLLARWQLGDLRRTAWVFGGGAVLLGASLLMRRWEEATTGVAQSGSYGDEARDLGLALLAYAGIQLLGDFSGERMRTWFARLTRPLADMGTMAFTIYCLHVLILTAIWSQLLLGEENWLAGPGLIYRQPEGVLTMVAIMVVCMLFATLWRRYLGVGPLERVIGVLSLRHPPETLLAVPSASTRRSEPALQAPRG